MPRTGSTVAAGALWVFLVTLILAGPIGAGGGQAAPPALVVGTEVDYPPFALGKPDGTPDGFTVELWRAVATEAGIDYTFKLAPFHEILEGFRDRSIGLLINLAQSDARRTYADFSVPHVIAYGAIFVREGESRVRSEADLPGRSLIVIRADLAHDYALSRGWENSLALVTDAEAGFRLLASGRHDAMLVAKLVGLQTLRELGLSGIRPLPERLAFLQKFSFAVPKGNAELLARINDGLAIVKANGTYDRLYEKWLGVLEPREMSMAELARRVAPWAALAMFVFGAVLVAYLRQRRLGAELAESAGQVRQLNAELEQRVRERTAQLQAANEELEAFCYSVSHDLRAPLRAIDGFSQALIEDHSAALGPPGLDHLGRVRAAAQRMAQLIDTLLDLSRLSRIDLRPTRIDLSLLASSVAADLANTEPGRRVDWVIEPGLSATADPDLARLALENLLGNAWKFTGHQAEARIEMGRTDRNGRPVFFVRDNGAGFDMAYAEKLFGAFQRLHGASEFEGNGIGLATVQRIVHRHGGEVWAAEAKPDHGATFHFTFES